jgi:large subunit ribosomal protein L29
MARELSKLREMSLEDLAREERELRDEVWKLRLQRATGQLADPHKVRKTRRELARLLTVRRERELAARAQAR